MAAKMRRAFSILHRVTLDPATLPDELAAALRAADAVADRHRLSEGAVYVAACRRYLMMTGRTWKETQLTATSAVWGGSSDHRRKIDHAIIGGVGLVLRWRCSCGEVGYVGVNDRDGAEAAHAEHAGSFSAKPLVGAAASL